MGYHFWKPWSLRLNYSVDPSLKRIVNYYANIDKNCLLSSTLFVEVKTIFEEEGRGGREMKGLANSIN